MDARLRWAGVHNNHTILLMTTDIRIISLCQELFNFELPSVQLERCCKKSWINFLHSVKFAFWLRSLFYYCYYHINGEIKIYKYFRFGDYRRYIHLRYPYASRRTGRQRTPCSAALDLETMRKVLAFLTYLICSRRYNYFRFRQASCLLPV